MVVFVRRCLVSVGVVHSPASLSPVHSRPTAVSFSWSNVSLWSILPLCKLAELQPNVIPDIFTLKLLKILRCERCFSDSLITDTKAAVSPEWNMALNHTFSDTLITSCLYSLPHFFPLHLLMFSLFDHPCVFVCAKCWCLSYVFSAFGLFSYCLPGLFGYSSAEPVWRFSPVSRWFVRCMSLAAHSYHFAIVNLKGQFT